MIDKLFSFAWLFMVITSWGSFGYASWHWLDHGSSRSFGFALFWLVINLFLIYFGSKFAKKSN